MNRRRKELLFHPGVTVGAFLLAFVLLLTSGIGTTRAALTYFSENYTSRVQMYDIGVSLVENEERISWRDYSGNGDGSWDEHTGVLLEHMLAEGERLKPGQAYPEELKVSNSGVINQYVRVTVSRYWTDQEGSKLRDVSPSLIGLNFVNVGSDWILDESSSTEERTVLYYSRLLNSGESTPLFADCLTIDSQIASKVTQNVRQEGGYTIIDTIYDYDGLTFCLEASVDAVQEHNAQDAIWSTWGRQIDVGDGSLRLE